MSAAVCSFCAKPAAEVRLMVAGPTCHICNECISLCADLTSVSMPDTEALDLAFLILGRVRMDLAKVRELLRPSKDVRCQGDTVDPDPDLARDVLIAARVGYGDDIADDWIARDVQNLGVSIRAAILEIRKFRTSASVSYLWELIARYRLIRRMRADLCRRGIR